MMRGWLRCLICAGLAWRADAALVIGNQTWLSSDYKYYGPNKQHLTGIAEVFEGDSTCTVPESASGKIVVISRDSTVCLFGEAYMNYRKAGVLALVEVTNWNPPGLLALRHHTWDSQKYASYGNLPAVAVYDVSGSIFEAIRSTDGPCYATLTSTSDDSFANMYLSWQWTVTLRLLAPAFAIYTAYLAALGLYHDHGSSVWTVRRVMFAIELPCLCATGAVLALGQYGPTVMPQRIHAPFFNLVNGGSVFTSVLVSLFLREEGRHLRTQSPRRPLRFQYPITISFSVLFFLCYDFITSLLPLTDLSTLIWEVVYGGMYCLMLLFQISVAVAFFVQARAFSGPLRFYLFNTSEDQERYGKKSANVTRVGRLAFWLAVSGLCMMTTAFGGAALAGAFLGVVPMLPNHDFSSMTLIVAIVLTRIGTSYAQIKGIRTEPEYTHAHHRRALRRSKMWKPCWSNLEGAYTHPQRLSNQATFLERAFRIPTLRSHEARAGLHGSGWPQSSRNPAAADGQTERAERNTQHRNRVGPIG